MMNANRDTWLVITSATGMRTVRWAMPTLLFLTSSGCSRDVRLAGRKIPSVAVRAVTHYGMTLNEQASPEQVAYVLLRAIRDDVLAESNDRREAALERQFDVCAANVLQERNRTSLVRDEYVYNRVYRWTPMVSHYIHDFPTDWESAKARLVGQGLKTQRSATSDGVQHRVFMGVEDPSGEAQARVVLAILLVRDSGFWRVFHIGFDPTRRSLGEKASTVDPAKSRDMRG